MTRLWDTGGRMLWHLRDGADVSWPGCDAIRVSDHRIWGPGGAWLDFTSLEYVQLDGSNDLVWRHRVRNGYRKTYGARLIENVVQWLARMVISQAIARLVRAGFRIPLTVHDDVFVLIERGECEKVRFAEAVELVGQQLAWLPRCPINVEYDLLEALDK